MRRLIVILTAAVLGWPLAAKAASQAAINAQAKAAFVHWRAEMLTHGALTLPDEVAACFAGVKARPYPTRAAYCIALDHFTVVDAEASGEVRPDFFSDAAVGDRFGEAVVEVTPESGRIAFQRQLEIAFAPYDKRLKAKGN